MILKKCWFDDQFYSNKCKIASFNYNDSNMIRWELTFNVAYMNSLHQGETNPTVKLYLKGQFNVDYPLTNGRGFSSDMYIVINDT
jgi:hypothetical protein